MGQTIDEHKCSLSNEADTLYKKRKTLLNVARLTNTFYKRTLHDAHTHDTR